VSLILEALKKVERERATPEQRGFLVLGPTAWASSRSNLAWVLGMIAAAAVAGGAVYVLTRPPAGAAFVAPRAAPRVAEGPAQAPLADPTDVPPAANDWQPPPPTYTPTTPPAANGPTPENAGAAPERTPPGPVLLLHAISEQDGTPVAVVNERVVREGDSFDGVRILRIGAAEVEVEVAGTRRTLRF
jgi:hypothetical protein